MSQVTETDIFRLYNDTFNPLYADVVAVLGCKPEQISFEIEAAFSHLAAAHDNQERRQNQLNRSFSHLQRASIDAAKILWLEYRERASQVLGDKDQRKYSVKNTHFLNQFHEAEQLAIQARRMEMTKTEFGPDDVLKAYYNSAMQFQEALSNIDDYAFERIVSAKKQKEKMMWLSSAVATGIGGAVMADIFTNQSTLIIAGGLVGALIGFFASGVRQWIK